MIAKYLIKNKVVVYSKYRPFAIGIAMDQDLEENRVVIIKKRKPKKIYIVEESSDDETLNDKKLKAKLENKVSYHKASNEK